jgi:excisionase family DNA binding protein
VLKRADGTDRKMSERLEDIFTIDEVAAYLKASKRTVYRLATTNQIPAFKLGGTWRFRRAELDKWIADRISNTTSTESDGAEHDNR